MSGWGAAQLLPPPRDGDIRTVYWELQNASDVWLTLEPRTAKGERAPDYWAGHVPIGVIRWMARAKRITGSSLGFPFELSASQRQAIRTWLERIESRN